MNRKVAGGIGIVVCATCALVSFRATAHDQESLPKTTVEMIVRSPQGKPLVNAKVNISSGEHFFTGQERPTASPTTDNHGLARFSWPVGLQHLQVMVDAVGYAATGRIELLEGKTATISLPPLVPFGAIEGRVAKDSLASGVYVAVSSMNGSQERKATCDKEGKFIFENLPASDYGLLLQPSSRAIRTLAPAVVRPGQRVRGVVVRKEASANVTREEAMMFGQHYGPEKTILWAAGQVHDEAGKAVEGADVFAVVNFYGGIRMYERIKATKTDKAGHWEFQGSDSISSFSGMLIAHKASRPYTYVSMQNPMPDANGAQTVKIDVSHYDLVLPAQGGSLEISVLEAGKPLMGAAVEIRRMGGPGIDDPAYVGSDRGPYRAGVDSLVRPSGATNIQDVVRFTDLVPGEYSVTAINGQRGDMWTLHSAFRSENEKAYAEVGHVSVQMGSVTKRTIELRRPQRFELAIKVLSPQGKLFDDGEIQISGASPLGSWEEIARTHKPKMPHRYSLSEAGLHPIEVKSVDLRARRRDSSDLPYDEATAIVGASSVLPAKQEIELTAVRRNIGSLIVTIQDPSGKPLRAYVLVDRSPFSDVPLCAGTTNDQGIVRFEGLQAGKHTAEVFIAGEEFAPLSGEGEAMPMDKVLIGRMIMPHQEFTTSEGKESRLFWQAKRAGYVRGVIKPPPGRTPADYTFSTDASSGDLIFSESYNQKTGEFVAGPFAEGMATISVYDAKRGYGSGALVDEKVAIATSHVSRAEISVPKETDSTAKPKPHNARQAFIGMGGISMLGGGSQDSRGRIYLSDGKTPAYAAISAFFVPNEQSPVGRGEADALGRISVSGAWYSPSQEREQLAGSPAEPVLVTWLPGFCGAAITPLHDERDARNLKIVLPPPLQVMGKVTVGGKINPWPACQLRVCAQYEGKGKLNALLSQSVVPDADGHFELSALTPGSYRVQAAMDGIWLSPSVRVAVQPGKQGIGPLQIDIGAPGPAVVLKVVDRKGIPQADVKASVERPEGPLAEALWPREFASDGAGVIYLPPLEVGTHRVQVGGAKERAVVVPTKSDAGSIKVAEPLVVQ